METSKIKSIVFLSVLFLFLWMTSSAQENFDLLVKQIKTQYEKINRDAKSFRVTDENIYDLSSEGGMLKRFYDGNELKKAALTLFGETGQSTTEYYFLNGDLIYAKSYDQWYKEPIYMGKPVIDSLDKNEFYFKAQILVRWADNSGKTVEQSQYLQKQIEILEDLSMIRKSLKDK